MLKLGSQVGSVINHLQSRGVIGEPVPVVGMGASVLLWSDRHAASIIGVEALNSKVYQCLVSVQEDNAMVVQGSQMDGSAKYVFSPNPNGPVRYFAKVRASGFWVPVIFAESGRLKKVQGPGLRIGERDHYYDPSF